jgi:3-phenylpropionate/cinnamic acid dioxygenase small subunit
LETVAEDLLRINEQLGRLADRAEIEDLISAYAQHLDTKNWEAFAALFTAEAALVMPWEGETAGVSGRDQLAKFCDDALGGFRRTHHLIATSQITIEGDRAGSTHYLHASHVRSDNPEDHWDVGGWYLAEYARTREGWRFTRVELDAIWQTGISNAQG